MGALPPVPNWKRMSALPRDRVDTIVIHTAAAADATHDEIIRWHLARGWTWGGYHWTVDKAGVPLAMRPIDVQGAHASVGAFNRRAIGVCALGHGDDEAWTDAQRDALVNLCGGLCDWFGIDPVGLPGNPREFGGGIIGHRDCYRVAGERPKKTCPGKAITDEAMADLRERVRLTLANEPLT